MRGWQDEARAPLHELCFPSALYNQNRDLAAKGFILGQSLHEIGVLTGRAPATALASLAKVSGVSAVEESRSDYHTQAE